MLQLKGVIEVNEGQVWCVAWNPDGTQIISCGQDKKARLFDLKSLLQNDENENKKDLAQTLVVSFGEEVHKKTIRYVAWALDGAFVGLASFDGTVSIWQKNNRDLKLASLVQGHENEVKCIDWAPSGQFFATCGRDKSVMIWSGTDDEEFDFNCEDVLTVHSQDVKRVVWSPKEDVLASCSYDNTIKIIEENDGDWTVMDTLEGHGSTVWAIDFDSTGTRLVSVSDDRTMKIWARTFESEGKKSWVCVSTLGGFHDRPIYDVSWNKVDGTIATACGDNKIRIFMESKEIGETNIFNCFATIEAHDTDVNCVKWNPNPQFSNFLASAGEDGSVKMWKFVQ